MNNKYLLLLQIFIKALKKSVENTDLTQNQADTAAGCISSLDDNDCRNCRSLMANFGIPFGSETRGKQTCFRVE